MNRPNIIIITCHDLGDYLGCYGTPVPTYNIDAMAKQGVVLQNHFSTGTVCSPSRGSIITGCYPHTHGLMGLVHRGWELNVDKCIPLPEILHRHGYQTNLFGFQHEHWNPKKLGYEYIYSAKTSHCDDVTPLFIDWLCSENVGNKPFFAALGFSETHRMGLNPSHFKRNVYEPADPSKVEVRPYLPDIPEIREDLADFYGAIKLVDKMVGKILQALDELHLSENTLFIFTTDHGASFMHSKATLYDGGTKTACIMRWPGILPAGLNVKALTSHVDLLPTLLDLLGIDIPSYIQGISFAPLIQGKPGNERKYIYAEKNYTNYYDPSRMIRSHSFKYIRKGLNTCIFDFVIPEIELAPWGFRNNKAVFNFYSATRCREELYDLNNDPGEMHNLAGDPAYAEILAELSAALDQHLEATDDPFRFLRNDILMPTHVYESVRSSK